MGSGQASPEDELWEIERIAGRYEAALKRGDFRSSIETLLASLPHLPRAELLKALIETELDVLGARKDSVEVYTRRFPAEADLIRSLLKVDLNCDRPPLVEGEQVGSYRVGRLLGKGAIGYVYLATTSNTEVKVAIKILRPDRKNVRGRDYDTLFFTEARIGSTLNHSRIVKLLESGEHRGLPFHVFEFIEGATFRNFRGRRLLDPIMAASMIAEVAEAVHYAHQRGVVHRDLKPSNLIVDSSGRVHVTDFGIALEDSQQGKGARVVGTPLYMSPEQLGGDSDLVDGRADIYALAVILYEAVAGVHPTIGAYSADRALNDAVATKLATPIRQRVAVSARFERICMRALAQEPAHRFSTAADFAKALRHFVWLSRAQRGLPLGAACVALVACLTFAVYSSRFVKQYQAQAVSADVVGTPVDLPGSSVGNASLDNVLDAASAEHGSLGEVQENQQPPSLTGLLSKGLEGLSPSEAKQAAELIITELQTSQEGSDQLWEYFSAGADNTLQSALIHSCAAIGLDKAILTARLDVEADVSIRVALLLAMGEYSLEQFPQTERERLLPELLTAYCNDPHGGLHSSVEWLLRHWGFTQELMQVNQRLWRAAPQDNFAWYTVLPDITMVVCDSQLASSPQSDAHQPHRKFAISTHEVSTQQWEWISGALPVAPVGTPASLAKNSTSWHTCAALCNQLSERVGLPSSDFCYERMSGNFYRAYDDATSRRGFRMPTVAEWTQAARADTTTSRYWGRADELLAKYANCRRGNAPVRLASGTLKPNRLGLFDVLGNVSEWMHDSLETAQTLGVTAQRSVRGGSAWSQERLVQVDEEFFLESSRLQERLGLRVVQTLLPAPSSVLPVQLKLTTRKRIGLTNGSPADRATRGTQLALEATQPLFAEQPAFIGRMSRGEEIDHHLLIENRSAAEVSLPALEASGCLELTEAWQEKQTLLPGASLSVPLRQRLTHLGRQQGRVTIHWLEADGKASDIHYDLVCFVAGPAVAAMEVALDDEGRGHLDFGRVAPGTKLRQLITLHNVGDEALSLLPARTSGKLRLKSDPAPVEVIGVGHAYYDIELDTSSPGAQSGSLAVGTGDPLLPNLRISASVTVEDLPKIPVLGLFREGKWLLDYSHDGIPDRTIEFGEQGDQPLAGDFDGDGIAELAIVRRNSAGQMSLHVRFEEGQQESIRIRNFDVASGLLVVGDYDGDSRCDVAWVSQAADSNLLAWQIDTDGDMAWDESELFGLIHDTPVMGDWDGDGCDDIGIVRRSPHNHGLLAWFFHGRGTPAADREVHYGLNGDLSFVADFNGDGRTDLGVYRTLHGAGKFLFDLDLDPANERLVDFGIPSGIPIAFMSSPLGD